MMPEITRGRAKVNCRGLSRPPLPAAWALFPAKLIEGDNIVLAGPGVAAGRYGLLDRHRQGAFHAGRPFDLRLPGLELQAEFEAKGGHWYCHYNGSAANYSLIGYAFAQALLER